MPHYTLFDRQGNVVQNRIAPQAELDADLEAHKDLQVNSIRYAELRALFNHENRLRQLTRALRASSTAANNAATSAGLPTAANSADLTAAQFITALKSLL
jgi:hypothetical protein